MLRLKELNLEATNSNPFSGRKQDLNPGPPDIYTPSAPKVARVRGSTIISTFFMLLFYTLLLKTLTNAQVIFYALYD